MNIKNNYDNKYQAYLVNNNKTKMYQLQYILMTTTTNFYFDGKGLKSIVLVDDDDDVNYIVMIITMKITISISITISIILTLLPPSSLLSSSL